MSQLPTQPFSLIMCWRGVALIVRHIQVVAVMVLAAIALSGCVDSEVGIRFENPHRGEIVQTIRLGEQLQQLQGENAQQWLKAIERQAKAVGGRVQRSANQASGLIVKIPFNNSQELEQKFNQFFSAVIGQAESANGDRALNIESHLTVSHSNFLLLERDRLRYEIDLRSLGVVSADGELLVSPASLVNLEFRLETPWGARSIIEPDGLRSRSRYSGRELIWLLAPGKQNALEAVFWLPSPIGIGAVLIILLVIAGQFLRYSRLSAPAQARSPS